MIVIQHLSKQYQGEKQPVLKDISYVFPDAGLVFLVGKSGCGKSTLLNLIGSIDEDYDGSIKVNGKELSERNGKEKADYRLSEVSIAFQSFHASEEESVLSNRMKGLAVLNIQEKEKKERVRKALEDVGLSGKGKRKFKDLSGGEKKRVSLARAARKNTPVLLADEPLASLNKGIRKQITDYLIRLSKSRLVFVITHETNEIPSSAIVLERKEGTLHVLREKGDGKEKLRIEKPIRKKYKGLSLLSQIYYSRKARHSFLLLARRTFVIGLFSVSFSFQLSRNISASRISSMESYREGDSFVVEPKEEGLYGTYFEPAGDAALSLFRRNHPETVLSKGYFFPQSRNDIFGPNQACVLRYGSRTRDRPKLSLDSFLNSLQISEIGNREHYGEEPMEKEDILIGLDRDGLLGLSYFILNDSLTKLTDKDRENRGEVCSKGKIILELSCQKEDWRYHFSQSFRIKGFFESETPVLITSDYTFPLWFLQDQRGFLLYEKEEDRIENKPWSLFIQEGLKLLPSKAKDFLKVFLKDKDRNPYVPSLFKRPGFFAEKDVSTHNHILLYKDILPKISVPDIEGFARSYLSCVSSLSYSSSVYTYTASGYISGFSKPFFFSRDQEKLNEIQDNYSLRKENLEQFQSTLIEVPDSVRKADLVSSRNGEGLRFTSLNQSGLLPDYGITPSSIDEIGISSKRAEKFFSSSRLAIGKELCTLTLTKTYKDKDKYRNSFAPGRLKITAVYNDDTFRIYQDSLFPLCYCFSLGALTKEECRITQAVRKTDLEAGTADDYRNRIRNYGSFKGSYPRLSRIEEIQNRLNRLSKLFLSFSFLSLVSAFTLLSLSRYLIIRKETKEIGIRLSLGYRKEDIAHYYFCFSLVIGLISYLRSSLLSLFTQKAIEKALSETRNRSKIRMQPFVYSFFLGAGIILLVFFLVYLFLLPLSPKDAFSKH